MKRSSELREKVRRAFLLHAASILFAALAGAAITWLAMTHAQDRIDAIGESALALLAALALVIVVAASWRTYRGYSRAVGPMRWLAGRVRDFDPRSHAGDGFAPDDLPRGMDAETRVLASSLHEMSQHVQELVERERSFTRDSSHELRTPLTVIRIASDLLLSDPGQSEYARRSLRRIQDAGREMEALIDSFLLLARAPDMERTGEEARVADLVYEQVEDVRPLLEGKDVDLHVEHEFDFLVQAPSRVVAVLIGNLLRNACIFTDRGRIVVRIGRGEVTVEDSGVGMSEDVLARAFEPFYRATEGRRGHGIGLSIVRRLSDRFGWSIDLDSTPERGTVARVRFPEAEVVGRHVVVEH
ncbi:sensor histidine kinase [Coralloluteibacterium stylophorae]|uniref:histidine kinase n=1 Tax=Coralloluteibacterium stylophorae TaxID=1776034 RepID=A0A8J8AZU5_9GAMM|nr:HAMP domain-containing sensor histidine kinase [Coralloluteibacterium stylophorae]MBS7456105.1 HAMP domain-containing histidine kinase [Coralloluteibacterium stylophorae]